MLRCFAEPAMLLQKKQKFQIHFYWTTDSSNLKIHEWQIHDIKELELKSKLVKYSINHKCFLSVQQYGR